MASLLTLDARIPPPESFVLRGEGGEQTFHLRHFTVADENFIHELGANAITLTAPLTGLIVALRQLPEDEIQPFCEFFGVRPPEDGTPKAFKEVAVNLSPVIPSGVHSEVQEVLVRMRKQLVKKLQTDSGEESDEGSPEKKSVFLRGLRTLTLHFVVACMGGTTALFLHSIFLTS